MIAEHLEDDLCWCADTNRRIARLDAMFPDRCQLRFGPGSPQHDLPTCILPAGHAEPHSGNLERPGGPCHFCGATYDGDMCPACWTSLEGMNVADLKAVFATIDLSIDPS